MTSTIKINKHKNYGAGRKGVTFEASIGDYVVTHGDTSEQAKVNAYDALLQAHKHLGNLTAVRVAKDGTVLLVRQTGDDCAQVEYNRRGFSGSVCLGRMSSGYEIFKDVQKYADYLIEQYQGKE